MDQILDVRGLKCPLPVLKARRALREVPIGDRLSVLTTDPQAAEDFVHFCATTGQELAATEDGTEHVTIVIRRVV